jgi:hypothetical protein
VFALSDNVALLELDFIMVNGKTEPEVIYFGSEKTVVRKQRSPRSLED